MKKPPLGLEPRYIYESIRIKQITDAIRRYMDADKDIPVEWIEEYNDLQSRQIHVIPLEKEVKFDDPPPRPDRCYVCGFYHSLGVACPDGTK